MQEYTIKLNTIEDVKEFVQVVALHNFEIDLVSGRYAVDAKSIMGIFSLDLSKPIGMRIHCDECGDFLKLVEKFMVK